MLIYYIAYALKMESVLDTLASGMIVLQHAVVSIAKLLLFKLLSLSPTLFFSQKKKGRGQERREKRGKRGREWKRRKEKIWAMIQHLSS